MSNDPTKPPEPKSPPDSSLKRPAAPPEKRKPRLRGVGVLKDLGGRFAYGILLGGVAVFIFVFVMLAVFFFLLHNAHRPFSIKDGFLSRGAIMAFWVGVGGFMMACLAGRPSGSKDERPRLGWLPVLSFTLVACGLVSLAGYVALHDLGMYAAFGGNARGMEFLMVFGGLVISLYWRFRDRKQTTKDS
jgi:hypothetical protein